MKIIVHFRMKSNILAWSNQYWKSELSDGASIDIRIEGIRCKVIIIHSSEERAKNLLYIIWELCAWYDGYFYKPIQYFVGGKRRRISELHTVNCFSTDEKWISSALLIGRNKRCFSEKIIRNYSDIRYKDRKQESMNREMFSSYFYLKSKAYKDINLEHRLVLLLHICDGFALEFLNGDQHNSIGNICKVIDLLGSKKYKHGAKLLGVSSKKAKKSLGYTRDELTHFVYKKDSLGAYISNPNYKTDNMVNLYAFYVLESALRIALLEGIGYEVEDDVKDFILDENLDWIRLVKLIDEDCVIPQNYMIQVLRKLGKGDNNM